METVTVSPEYQVVIPESMRQALGIKPGQKVSAIRYGNRIEIIPFRTITEARGFLAGIDTHIQRKLDRL